MTLLIFVRCIMLLRRFSVCSEGFHEHYIFDYDIEGVLEEYAYEDKDDALLQCKKMNKEVLNESIYKINETEAKKINIGQKVRFVIHLSDSTYLSFEIDKKGKTLNDFITKLTCCDIEEVNIYRNCIDEIIFGEA